MSNNEQSSVQQFWDKIALKLSVDQINEFVPLFEQAKEMENENRIKSQIKLIKSIGNQGPNAPLYGILKNTLIELQQQIK